MKQFSDEWIAELNRTTKGTGMFVKAVIVFVELDGSDNRYFVDAQREVVFQGNTYAPLWMRWEGLEVSTQLQLPTVRVTVPNLGGEVIDYLEEVDLLGHLVVLRIFYLDLMERLEDFDDVTLQIIAIEGDLQAVTFTLGMDVSLREALPRHVITRTEFPAVPDNIRRATIL
jgi:hypothetical protein